MMKRESFTLTIPLGYLCEDSPIICPDGTAAPSDPVMTYTQAARPGSRAPHLWLSPDRSTLDLFGQALVLLKLGNELDVSPFERAAVQRVVPVTVVELNDPAVK